MMSVVWLALISAVPPIAVGPDAALTAQQVEAPIARVTVFEDRARVTRRASIALQPGASVWRLPDIPASAELGALRATVSGARLLRVEATPAERDRLPLEPAAKLLDRIDVLSDAIKKLDAERDVVSARLALVAGLAPAAPVPEAQREGRPPSGLFAEIWTKVTAALTAERIALRARLAGIEAKRAEQVLALDEARREVARLDIDGSLEQVVEVVVVLEAARAGSATVELEYFVPGARWRPAYALHFFADAGRAELDAFGMVSQSTGEDWRDVELSLSTAIPSLGIELPKLQTWTLGEAKEWRPVVYPRTTPPAPPVFPQPEPRPTALEIDRAAERAVLFSRLGSAVPRAEPRDKDAEKSKAQDYRLDLGGLALGKSAPAAEAPPPPPPPAPPVRVLQRQRAMESVAEESVAITSAPGSLFSADSAEMEQAPARAFALFEAPPPARPHVADPTAPAALAGGLDHVYRVPTRVTVASNGEAHRAPLGRETHPVSAFYEATPALAPEAYLRATVTNRSPRPILGGPVGIFLGTAFAGDGQLATTGAGGTLALPLGADEDVRVSRKLILTTERTGVLSKDDVSTYRVVMEVASFKTKPIRVVIREPLPKSGNEDIEIERVSVTPKAAGPDADGIMRWELDVAPGKVATVELVYRVERPADWQLYQR